MPSTKLFSIQRSKIDRVKEKQMVHQEVFTLSTKGYGDMNAIQVAHLAACMAGINYSKSK